MSQDYLKKLSEYKSNSRFHKTYIEINNKKECYKSPLKTFSGIELAGLAQTQTIDPRSWIFWNKVELIEDNTTGMIQESFLPGCKFTHFPAFSYAFGSDAPPSSKFLLHYGKNWEKNLKSDKIPVLLVPGAGDNAHRAFADPSYGIPGLNKNTALAQYLDDAGFPVFAITFAHNQGDNFIQCEAISNAIKRIRIVSKSNKVDIIAHSKGNVAVRMYISNIRALYDMDIVFSNVKKVEVKNGEEIEKRVNVVFPSKRWMSPFEYDVRRYIQLAAPNKGVDAVFRAFTTQSSAYISKQAPIPFIRYWIKEDEKFESLKESIYYESDNPGANNYFPGQCQILYDLAKEDIPLQNLISVNQIGLPVDVVKKMYYGGHSRTGDSLGIEYAIAQGGKLIEQLRTKGTSSYVEVATAVGTKNLVNITYASIPIPIVYEGVKSDGLLFYVSASDTTGISNSMGVYEFPLNHIELTYDNTICKWVEDVLSYK